MNVRRELQTDRRSGMLSPLPTHHGPKGRADGPRFFAVMAPLLAIPAPFVAPAAAAQTSQSAYSTPAGQV